MHNLMLIEKFSSASGCWSNLVRDNRMINLSVEDVVNKYQGFEGELLGFFNIEENNQKLEVFIGDCLQLKKLSNSLLIHVISDSGKVPDFLKDRVMFMGYDVGACNEETIYSSIFNEILFGGYNELACYKKFLNESLLFQDRKKAENYVDLHDQMSAQGKNVEDYMEMVIYEIWKHKVHS